MILKHKQEEKIYILLLSLVNSDPLIWRKISMSSRVTLYEFHLVIQDIMDWENRQPWLFKNKKNIYIDLESGSEGYPAYLPQENANITFLDEVFSLDQPKLTYIYDFHDNWIHEILLEEIQPVPKDTSYPHCIEGAMAAPPEESGGMYEYLQKLRILQDPSHEYYKTTRSFFGIGFDPEMFNRATINKKLELYSNRAKEKQRIIAAMPQTKEKWVDEIVEAYHETLKTVRSLDAFMQIYRKAPAMAVKNRKMSYMSEPDKNFDFETFLKEFYKEYDPIHPDAPIYENNPMIAFCLWYLFYHSVLGFLEFETIQEILFLCRDNLERFKPRQ